MDGEKYRLESVLGQGRRALGFKFVQEFSNRFRSRAHSKVCR
jgi:hypothetical protein